VSRQRLAKIDRVRRLHQRLRDARRQEFQKHTARRDALIAHAEAMAAEIAAETGPADATESAYRAPWIRATNREIEVARQEAGKVQLEIDRLREELVERNVEIRTFESLIDRLAERQRGEAALREEKELDDQLRFAYAARPGSGY
jgi:flagellar export protein FliJ